jgi:hypothetical protein
MPQRQYALRVQRLAILRMVVGGMLEHRENMFGTLQLPRGDDDTTVLLFLAVSIGHAEGNPMNATKLAHFIHIPRTTVLRKLDRLIKLGLVVKHDGHSFVIAPHRARTVTAGRHARYVKMIRRFIQDLVDSGEGENILPDSRELQWKRISSVLDTQEDLKRP